MNKIDDILIINTGGTFSKVYDEVKGKVVARVPYIGWPKVIFSRLVHI